MDVLQFDKAGYQTFDSAAIKVVCGIRILEFDSTQFGRESIYTLLQIPYQSLLFTLGLYKQREQWCYSPHHTTPHHISYHIP